LLDICHALLHAEQAENGFQVLMPLDTGGESITENKALIEHETYLVMYQYNEMKGFR